MRFLFALSSLALVACRTSLDVPATRGGDCSQWTDAASCTTHGCAAANCDESCDGAGPSFSSCYDPSDPVPQCIPLGCPVSECDATTEASCIADASCFAIYEQAPCDCAGVDCCAMVFHSCASGPPTCDPGPVAQPCTPGPECDPGYLPVYPTGGGCQVGCVEAMLCDSLVADCSSISTQVACDADPSCYSLFTRALCNCGSPDCCPMVFESCADGPPQCGIGPDGPGVDCTPVTTCDDDYVPAYNTAGCDIGCVPAMVCGE
jgi:hypothetical protein